MACPSIETGRQFLQSALAHIDCQAQAIGSYGYGALADPGSPASIALTGILVIFIAIFGLRLALRFSQTGPDIAGDAIRLVIVLTLATSWPAWRVIGYDLLIAGPAELSSLISSAAGLPGSAGDLVVRLQRVDDAFAFLNERGAGRRGVANGDWFQLGFARSAFLTGTLGSLALVRIFGGILLAIAPVIAGLLLFGVTRSIFVGWAKALAAMFLASLALAIMLAVELALLEPWIEGVVRLRSANEQTLSAPTEGLILTLAFALACFGSIAVAVRIAFNPSFRLSMAPAARPVEIRNTRDERNSNNNWTMQSNRQDRAQVYASSVASSIERYDRLTRGVLSAASPAPITRPPRSAKPADTSTLSTNERLGSSYRRNSRRISQSGMRRDGVE